MALVFAAVTPHPPLLIPTIGREELNKVNQTKLAMEELAMSLYATHPDTIIIISPHGSYFNEVFTINFCVDYVTDLRDFGDLATTLKFHGDAELAFRIRDATKRQHLPATMISENHLDHGTSVPLYYLTKNLPQIKLLQLGFCDLDYKTHVDFGGLIKELVMSTNKRVAVIASGDLSHALTNDAPAGFNKRGPEFDAKIRELLMSKNLTGMINIDPRIISEAAECGMRSILILLGMLQGINYTFRELSYEAPFGVGYLTAQFSL